MLENLFTYLPSVQMHTLRGLRSSHELDLGYSLWVALDHRSGKTGLKDVPPEKSVMRAAYTAQKIKPQQGSLSWRLISKALILLCNPRSLKSFSQARILLQIEQSWGCRAGVFGEVLSCTLDETSTALGRVPTCRTKGPKLHSQIHWHSNNHIPPSLA